MKSTAPKQQKRRPKKPKAKPKKKAKDAIVPQEKEEKEQDSGNELKLIRDHLLTKSRSVASIYGDLKRILEQTMKGSGTACFTAEYTSLASHELMKMVDRKIPDRERMQVLVLHVPSIDALEQECPELLHDGVVPTMSLHDIQTRKLASPDSQIMRDLTDAFLHKHDGTHVIVYVCVQVPFVPEELERHEDIEVDSAVETETIGKYFVLNEHIDPALQKASWEKWCYFRRCKAFGCDRVQEIGSATAHMCSVCHCASFCAKHSGELANHEEKCSIEEGNVKRELALDILFAKMLHRDNELEKDERG